jgi:D-alanyl-D-alanine endopeptidase (penicillin-binding protein 7)
VVNAGLRFLVLVSALAVMVGLASATDDLSQVARLQPPNPFWSGLDAGKLDLRSASVLVVDEAGNTVYRKGTTEIRSIASITKLMTAMVVLDAGVDLDRRITIGEGDRDRLKQTGSRLYIDQATLTRRELLLLALMSSENRAASALGRTTFAGGKAQFVRTMNRKARALGMGHSRFLEPTGLDPANVSTAEDLVKLAQAAFDYPFISAATTRTSHQVRPYAGRGPLRYVNTNRLVRSGTWNVELSKTGYIREAGRCLVMRARIAGRPLYIVLLDAYGKLTPVGDSNRLRNWINSEIRPHQDHLDAS